MMETSVWIAQLLALVYLAVGIGFMVDKKYYQKMLTNWTKGDDGMANYMGGFFALVAGYVLVNVHNTWDGPFWVSVISLIGWLALIKGIVLLVMPSKMMEFFKPMIKNQGFMNLAGYACLVIGLFFAYYGYYA